MAKTPVGPKGFVELADMNLILIPPNKFSFLSIIHEMCNTGDIHSRVQVDLSFESTMVRADFVVAFQ